MARRSRGLPVPRRSPLVLVALAIAAVAALLLARSLRDHGGAPAGGHERLPPGPAAPLPAPPPPRAQPAPVTLDVEGIGDADEQAAITGVARAIDRGGPFAYRKDGVVFENREHRLPDHPRGHWREYTVPTPGSADRGARRIIGGGDGELFYTRDHYRTFRRVRGPTRY